MNDAELIAKNIIEKEATLKGNEWFVEENEYCWQLFAENIQDFGYGPIYMHPWQLIKAPKRNSSMAEYWPEKNESDFICYTRNNVVALAQEYLKLVGQLKDNKNDDTNITEL